MLGNRFFNKKPSESSTIQNEDRQTDQQSPLPADEEKMDKKTIAESGSGGFPGVQGHPATAKHVANAVTGNAVWFLADIPGHIQTGLTDEQKVVGPLTFAQMCQYASSGMIDQKNSLVWTEGMKDWVPAGEVSSFFTSSKPPKVPNKPLAKHGIFFKIFAMFFSLICMIAMIPLLIFKAIFYGVKVAKQKTGVPKMSLKVNLWLALFVQTAFCLFMLLLLSSFDGPAEEVFVVGTVFSSLTAVIGHFVWVSLLCRLWEKVPQKYQTESSETLFPLFYVPFIHFYAMFLAIPNLRFGLHQAIHPGSEQSPFEKWVLRIACVLCVIPGANIIGSLIMAGWLVSIRKEVAYFSEAKEDKWMPVSDQR